MQVSETCRAAGYVQAIRSTPLLVHIYVIYFAMPALLLLDRQLSMPLKDTPRN